MNENIYSFYFWKQKTWMKIFINCINNGFIWDVVISGPFKQCHINHDYQFSDMKQKSETEESREIW